MALAEALEECAPRQRLVLDLIVREQPARRRTKSRAYFPQDAVSFHPDKHLSVCCICGHVMRYSALLYKGDEYCDQCFYMAIRDPGDSCWREGRPIDS